MSNKVIYAIYNDDDILMDRLLNQSSSHHWRSFLTFHHGLISYGLSTNKISNTLFYGCVGILCNLMMNYIMIQDWPQDIGGKTKF
jgi:hypothetical protein